MIHQLDFLAKIKIGKLLYIKKLIFRLYLGLQPLPRICSSPPGFLQIWLGKFQAKSSWLPIFLGVGKREPPKVYQVILSLDSQVEKIPGRWLDTWPSLATTIAGKSSQLKGDGSSKPSFVGFVDGSNVCFRGCRNILGSSNT